MKLSSTASAALGLDDASHEASPPPGRTPDTRKRRIAWAWIAVIAWALVIWHLGGDDFSAKNTNSFLLEWLHRLCVEVDPRTRYRFIMGLRKSAHFIEYAILATLTFRAAWISAQRHQLATGVWGALFLVAAVASADEARQTFSSFRTGSPYDVLIDLGGGIVAILGLTLVSRRARKARSAD